VGEETEKGNLLILRLKFPFMKILSLMIILTLSTCAGNKKEVKDGFQAKTFQANDHVDLLYNIYYPKTDKQKVPLFIFLHGAGERGNDNISCHVGFPSMSYW